MTRFATFLAGLLLGIVATPLAFMVWVTHAERQYARAFTAPPIESASPTAKAIAAKLSPGLQSLARQHEDDFVAQAGGPVVRFAARKAYPVVVRIVPVGVEVGSDRLLTHFGGLSVSEIAHMVVEHMSAKGEAVHPSLQGVAAGQPVGAMMCRCGPICLARKANGGGICSGRCGCMTGH